jgi:hypothetical protein
MTKMIIPKPLKLAGVTMLAALFAAAAEKPNIAYVLDRSRSVAAQAAQMKQEQKDAITALPYGAHCTLLAVGGTVRRLFEGDMDAGRRAELLHLVDKLPLTDLNSDLGGGLAEASYALASQPGRREIWMFTDGENRPMPGSRRRGMTFSQILTETAIPAGIAVHIRLFGNSDPKFNPKEATVYRSAPDWKKHFAPPAPPSPAPVPPPDAWLWRSGYVLVGAGALAAAFAWYRRESNAAWLMRQRLARTETATPPLPSVTFTVENEAGRALGRLSSTGTSEIRIGDSPLADVMSSDADGGVVRLAVVRTRGGELLELSNEGALPVHVGAMTLSPHRRQVLPLDLLEIQLGRLALRVVPEVPAEEEVFRG